MWVEAALNQYPVTMLAGLVCVTVWALIANRRQLKAQRRAIRREAVLRRLYATRGGKT